MDLKEYLTETLNTQFFEYEYPVREYNHETKSYEETGEFAKTQDDICDYFMDGHSYVNKHLLQKLFGSKGIEVETLETYGGDDYGYDYYSVIKFTYEDQVGIVKFQGHYYSYGGSYFDNWDFVEPKPVAKIEYVIVD
ncbi:MAG: hypothetical protein HRT61_01005 [Ekhidna sp.]|nr:hypothetical protein [Ekhidna sp.]